MVPPRFFRRLLFVFGVSIACYGTASRCDELVEHPDCEWVSTDWADGDSFAVKFPDGKTHVLRLYYVDCIETSISTITDKRRLREQARFFGVEDIRAVVEYGKSATQFTAEQLSSPFTVTTAFADARGRSGKPRYYAFVRTAEGKDLGRLLVEAGLARAFGLGRQTPSGISRDDWESYLSDLELSAAIRKNGVWKESDPDAIIALRQLEREEMRGLEAIDDAFALRPPEEPVDLNTASLEDLVRIGLRESLADAAIQMRPFRSVDDLDDVKGIGPVTLEKVRPYLKLESISDSKPAKK